MTVGELITILQQLPNDSTVLAEHSYRIKQHRTTSDCPDIQCGPGVIYTHSTTLANEIDRKMRETIKHRFHMKYGGIERRGACRDYFSKFYNLHDLSMAEHDKKYKIKPREIGKMEPPAVAESLDV